MREFLKSGTRLVLGNTEYVVESVVGAGKSSVVYRAWYVDQLNRDSRHEVLIKELFPNDPEVLIYRDENGVIQYNQDEDTFALMETYRKSFYQGNRANLRLLLLQPEHISGNINSFQAYGTYYSILSVHGGEDLEKILDKRGDALTLKQIVEWMFMILDALEHFHDNSMLHLDISPDNILMLSNRALLIDYNSVWQLDDPEQDFTFSKKEGYVSREVMLQYLKQISFASDLYSVAAVFFRMVVGRELSDEDRRGNGLIRCFPKNLKIFRDIPVSAAQQTVRILMRGLRKGACERYQSIGEMRNDLKELLNRIEGKGITHSAIWENSKRDIKKHWISDETYLERKILTVNGQILDQDECLKQLGTGRHFILTGSGGMGKTRLLLEYVIRESRNYISRKPALVYIPLAEYQESGNDHLYIHKYILKGLSFGAEVSKMDEAIHEFDQLVDQATEVRVILLLDGLNEAGVHRIELIKEIEALSRKAGIGILLTNRTDDVLEYGFERFQKAELLPLEEKVVCQVLDEQNIAIPKDIRMKELLQNPMMLSLYCKTVTLAVENGQEEQQRDLEVIVTMERLIEDYLTSLSVHEQRVNSGNEQEQLRHQYLLKHLLPEIAGELKRWKKQVLTVEEVRRLVEKSYHTLTQRYFARAFKEMTGKSRIILKDIQNADEWFDYAVVEQLANRLDLIKKTENGNYRLVHDNFLDYLSVMDEKNQRLIARYRRRERIKKVGVSAVACITAIGASIMAVKSGVLEEKKMNLTKHQQYVLDDAFAGVEANLGALSQQIALQQSILIEADNAGLVNVTLQDIEKWKNASEKEIYADPVILALNNFADVFLMQQKQIRIAQSNRDAGDVSKYLEDAGIELPRDSMLTLHQTTYDMDEIVQLGELRLIEYLLSTEYGGKGTARDKQNLLNSYNQCLDAYKELIYWNLIKVFREMNPEDIHKRKETLSYMTAFSAYVDRIDEDIKKVTETDLDLYIQNAEKAVRDISTAMNSSKLPFGFSERITKNGLIERVIVYREDPDEDMTEAEAEALPTSEKQKRIINHFSEHILQLDKQSYLYDIVLFYIDDYLNNPSEEKKEQAWNIIGELSQLLTLLCENHESVYVQERLGGWLEDNGVLIREYENFINSKYTFYAGYADSLAFLKTAVESSDPTVPESFKLLESQYTYALKDQLAIRQYYGTSVNYWFAGWENDAILHMQETVLSQMKSFIFDMARWTDSQEKALQMMTSPLDDMEAGISDRAEQVAKDRRELYDLQNQLGQ